jgi:hypothetical protein
MDTQEIIATLGRSRDAAASATDECLLPERLAAFLDGALCGAEHAAAEAHLADCDFCLGQLAALLRSMEDATTPAVPDTLRAQAERLAARPRHGTLRSFQWAAAAMLALALGLVVMQPPQNSTEDAAEPVRQTRYADQNALQPRLLAPAEGSVIIPLEQVFRWFEVPGALYYDVRLISPDGDLLLRERVEVTHWLIPQQLELEAGGEYFVRIDAYLSDARYLSSEHILFTVGGAE